jgi:hypothetical protein
VVDSGAFHARRRAGRTRGLLRRADLQRALFEARPSASNARDLVKEACEASETVTDLQREIRLAAPERKADPARTNTARCPARCGD